MKAFASFFLREGKKLLLNNFLFATGRSRFYDGSLPGFWCRGWWCPKCTKAATTTAVSRERYRSLRPLKLQGCVVYFPQSCFPVRGRVSTAGRKHRDLLSVELGDLAIMIELRSCISLRSFKSFLHEAPVPQKTSCKKTNGTAAPPQCSF